MSDDAAEPAKAPAEVEVEEKEPASLGEALLAFQALDIRVTLDETAEIPTKGGGGYSYRYSSLGNVLATVQPHLTKLKLVWSSLPTTLEDGQTPALYYELEFVPTKEKKTGTMSIMLRQGNPQDQGGAISYARRYALLAALNLAPDADEDGAVTQSQDGASQAGVKRITKPQAEKVYGEFAKAKIIEPDRFQLAISHAFGEDVGDCTTKAKAVKALQKVNEIQAAAVSRWIARNVEEAVAAMETEEGGGEN